jgi:hypothetical protein
MILDFEKQKECWDDKFDKILDLNKALKDTLEDKACYK